MLIHFRKTLGLFFLLICCFVTPLSYAEKVPYYRLSLQECFEMAVKNNEEIKAAYYDVQTIVAKKIEATKRYVPVVNYKYRVGPVPRDLDNPLQSLAEGDLSVFNSFRVEAGAPITTFGRLEIAQTLADLGIELKTLEKYKKEDEILLNIYKLYNGILLARELKGVINEGLEAVYNKVQELEKEETTDQLEILKLKVILYEAERRYQEAISKEQIALTTLKVLLGLEDAVNFDIKSKSLQKVGFRVRSFEYFLEQSKDNRPEFELLQKGVLAKKKKWELEKKEYYPKLGWGGFAELGVTPGLKGEEDDNDFVNPFNYTRGGLGLELSGTLDFRKTKARIEEAKADYLKTIHQKRAGTRGLELDLKKSYLELKQNLFLLSRAESDKKAARQIVFLTKSNLDLGLGDRKDYLDALQSYLVFQGRAYEAIFNYNNAVATLKAKMGTLFEEQKTRKYLNHPESLYYEMPSEYELYQ